MRIKILFCQIENTPGKGVSVRKGLKEAGVQSYEPTDRNSIQGKFPGELAQHNEALGSRDMVNAAVV